MANDVRLQEGHPVDENLRPVKVADETTALELSKTKVKVNNLILDGQILGKLEFEESDGGSISSDGSDFTISSSRDVIINANSKILIKQGDTTTIALDANGALGAGAGITLHSILDDSEYFRIDTTSNAVTTISTVDGSNVGHLTFDIAGDITLDSHTGEFIAKKAGTEFSVANSAYAGMILGYTTVGIDVTADSHTLVNATMTVTDSDHNVSFIAPPSGVVEIFVSVYGDFARRNPVFGLSDNATYAAIDFPNSADPTNEHILRTPPSSGGDTMLINRWVVTGLTAGDTYKWWLGAKTSLGAGGVLRWGGTATNQWPPFIMKATALPTAVADFAVYG